MSKKLDLNLRFASHEVELFRIFMENLNLDEEGEPSQYPLGVAIGYEEACEAGPLFPAGVAFDLCFEEPRSAYYFALRLQEARTAWQAMAAHTAALAAYPRFLYHPKLRTWLRYNSAEYFCLVSESQLQVRRERPQELYKPEEVEEVTEAAFLAAYRRTRELLWEAAQYKAAYQRRGSKGNEWFYCNPVHATSSANLPQHLRLNASCTEYGRSWQLLYAHDMSRYDTRRGASTEQEFAQQLRQLLAEVEAAATGGQEGGPPNG